MPRGGARINSGPPPDPNALRRDRLGDRDGWTTLPASGFAGPIPVWPLTPQLGDEGDVLEFLAGRESEHWARVWRTPQAAVWSRLGWSADVALYVRWLSLAEAGDLKAGTEARQWSDRLGLNPAAMLRNRWRVAADEVGEKRTAVKSVARRSARDRLKAVNGGDA